MANVWRDAVRCGDVGSAGSVHGAGSVHDAISGCRCAGVSDTRGQTFGRECHWWARRLCSARKGNLSAATVPASANAQHQGESARLPVSPVASCSPAWLTNARMADELPHCDRPVAATHRHRHRYRYRQRTEAKPGDEPGQFASSMPLLRMNGTASMALPFCRTS